MRIRTTAAALLLSSTASSSSSHLVAFTSVATTISRRRNHRAVTDTAGFGLTFVLKAASPTAPTPSTDKKITPPSDGTTIQQSASSSTTPPPPGSPLSEVVDSQQKFELSLGRAVDALKTDYPQLLTKNPTWKIYHAQLEVIDPTGVTMRGLENYKVAFGFVHGVVRWFYCEEQSNMSRCRVGYDWARRCIRYVILSIHVFFSLSYRVLFSCMPSPSRSTHYYYHISPQPNKNSYRVSWNVELVPKMIYGGTRNTLHVDGISEYQLDRESGLITEHRVTHLLINDQAVRPANGIFNALKEFAGTGQGQVDPEGVPVFSSDGGKRGGEEYGIAAAAHGSLLSWEDMKFVEFQTTQHSSSSSRSVLSLFSSPNDSTASISSSSSPDGMGYTTSTTTTMYDLDALQRKNASRKKFGKPPLTPEEYLAIEEEVRAMDTTNKKKAAYLAEQLAAARKNKKEKEDSFLSNIFGGVFKNGCESNFDCERPQVCCDVGFKRICCSNGLGIVDGIPVERYERGLLRVPLPNDNYDY